MGVREVVVGVCAATALSATGGCAGTSGSSSCTDIGVASSVRVDVTGSLVDRGVLHVDLCRDGDCRELAVREKPGASQDVSLDYAYSGGGEPAPSTLVAEVRAKNGRVLASTSQPVTFDARYPNGRSCGALYVVVSDPITLDT